MDEEILYNFRHARKNIEHFTGLTLKTSELLRIRQIAKEEVSKNRTTKSSFIKTIPFVEAFYCFLCEFYGFDATLRDRIEILFEIDENLNSSEAVKEWFRRQQDEMFLI